MALSFFVHFWYNYAELGMGPFQGVARSFLPRRRGGRRGSLDFLGDFRAFVVQKRVGDDIPVHI
jgi:hypothetical protein